MNVPFKKDPIEFKQRALFATNVFDLLPSDYQCLIYEDIFDQLDTSSVEEQFSILGQNACYMLLAFISLKMGIHWWSNPIGKVRNNLPFFKNWLKRISHRSLDSTRPRWYTHTPAKNWRSGSARRLPGVRGIESG